MITIIAGTNREDSMTLRTANVYYNLLAQGAGDVQLLSLERRAVWERGPEMLALEQQYLIPAEKFVFVIPEYNGGFPGVLKLMIDNSDIKQCWWYKKAMLVGLSDGRSGNLRGVEHLTAILHYMKMHVLYNKILLPRINEEMNSNGELVKPDTERFVKEQVNDFLKF